MNSFFRPPPFRTKRGGMNLTTEELLISRSKRAVRINPVIPKQNGFVSCKLLFTKNCIENDVNQRTDMNKANSF